MPRPEYPSDLRRRKQRPHVKIHLSVLSHRKTAGHFDNPEFRGMFLGLLMLAAERFAAKKDGLLVLSGRDIRWITSRQRRDHAELRMSKLLDQLEYAYSYDAVKWEINIPKFAKKQGYAPQSASLQRTKEPKNRRTKEPNKSAKPTLPQWAVEESEFLHSKLLARMPGVAGKWTAGKARRWAPPIAAIEATQNEIHLAIEFLFSPSNEGKYRIEVQCGDALNTKWGKILAAMSRALTTKIAPVTTGGMGKWQHG